VTVAIQLSGTYVSALTEIKISVDIKIA